MTGIRYRIAINLFTVGAPMTLSLTSQESVTSSPFKPPFPQWLGKGSKYIYRHLTPTKVQEKRP